ncbi:ABC transporter ATP-binding protein [Xanthobacter sp. YC-JY1]|uniref:ABC transporter ATP-binding protein n=1 Tax=Xanthobacter sp. YC-JY1 TaxID=2419844 RepID=UPI001F284A53|nr:ABC transporter ATP-binding protein [Xanthobacter sp. YC-JY1]UJX44596.1 ABC transporter ATP-binding protein [Xanthobacter sp. YC-JY1]
MTAPLLTIAGLTAGYGGTPALFGVDLSVSSGGALALVGRNGMGKTTTIRALMGLLPPSGGALTFDGVALKGLKPHRIARLGLGLVPEGRQIFPTLTVEENLVATAAPGRSGLPLWTLERVYGLFPRLAERRRNYGNRLSGGEQQMLAIGRALMTNPRLLILDEATEGLAPLIRAEIWAVLSVLKGEGLSLIVVDKHVSALAGVCDEVAVMEKGRVVHTGAAADFAGDAGLVGRYLGV